MIQETSVLSLVNYTSSSIPWGISRLVIGKYPFRNVPGLKFVKVLGCGKHGGFDLNPSFTKQGLLCVFDSNEHAMKFLNLSSILDEYKKHSNEFFSVMLQAYSSKGSWSKHTIEVTQSAPTCGPIAGITRASIKFSKASEFWSKAPPAQKSLEQAPGCMLAAGIGEAPYLRQATFTMWESSAAMDTYARSGAHLEAIQTAYKGEFFTESMFTRFIPIHPQGVWRGKHYG
jgi:spheroidene monooxygenase